MSEMSKRDHLLRRLLRVLTIVFLITAVATFLYSRYGLDQTAEPEDLPVFGEVPDFNLMDRTGERVSLDDLRGKIWVADFIFTNCAGTCQIMTTRMAQLRDTLPRSLDVHFVSVSVDPGRDTPEALTAFAQAYNADAANWYFLTGDLQEIIQLGEKGFNLSVGQVPEDQPAEEIGPIAHSIKFALVDRQGRIRGYYDGTDAASVEKLLQAIRQLHEGETT